MSNSSKQPWNHTRTCDYCASQSQGPQVFYKNGNSGCEHYRGGKTASKAGRSWPKLERGAMPTT